MELRSVGAMDVSAPAAVSRRAQSSVQLCVSLRLSLRVHEVVGGPGSANCHGGAGLRAGGGRAARSGSEPGTAARRYKERRVEQRRRGRGIR